MSGSELFADILIYVSNCCWNLRNVWELILLQVEIEATNLVTLCCLLDLITTLFLLEATSDGEQLTLCNCKILHQENVDQEQSRLYKILNSRVH